MKQSKPEHLKRGKWAENEARKYLIKQGLKLVCRNYLCQFGEIDLIMKDKDTLVLVEVRFRKSSRYGSAAESITSAKQAKILNSTNHFLASNPHKGPIRFDAIAISPDNTGKNHINWIANAFQA